MPHKQLLNLETGEFLLIENPAENVTENTFFVSDKTAPEDLIRHFGEDKLRITDHKNGHSNYNIYDLKIGDLYFILTFYFKELIEEKVNGTLKTKQLTTISFIFSKTPYAESNDSWDNFDEKNEKKKGQFMQNWLNLQINGSFKAFPWGDVGVNYDHHNLSYSCQIRYRDAITGGKIKIINQ